MGDIGWTAAQLMAGGNLPSTDIYKPKIQKMKEM